MRGHFPIWEGSKKKVWRGKMREGTLGSELHTFELRGAERTSGGGVGGFSVEF